MKMYTGSKELRLVGKAWEVRHMLRKLKGSDSKEKAEPLRGYLDKR